MAARTAPLIAGSTGPAAKRSGTIRKLLLLFLLALAAALGLVIFNRHNVNAPPVVFNVFADAALGIVVGLGSRMVFRRRHWLIPAIASAAFLVVALLVLGQLTAGRSGIRPMHLQRVPVAFLDRAGVILQLPAPPSLGPGLLEDLAHIVLAVSIAWIALRAWNGAHRGPVVRAVWKASTGSHVEPSPKPLSIVAPAPRAARVARIQRRPRLAVRRKKAASARMLVATPRTRIGARPARPSGRWRSILRRKPAVHLAAYEEHRCPYCLETVRRNDLRGTVECPVCHTLHHKDCWDVTGTCQVPHLSV